MTYLLQAGAAGAAAGQQPGAGGFWIMILLVFVIMWLFMIRPQRKQQKALDEFRSNLKKGDKVITAGGIYGTIVSADDHTVTLNLGGDVKIKVDKTSIQRDPSQAPATEPVKKNTEKDSAESEK